MDVSSAAPPPLEAVVHELQERLARSEQAREMLALELKHAKQQSVLVVSAGPGRVLWGDRAWVSANLRGGQRGARQPAAGLRLAAAAARGRARALQQRARSLACGDRFRGLSPHPSAASQRGQRGLRRCSTAVLAGLHHRVGQRACCGGAHRRRCATQHRHRAVLPQNRQLLERSALTSWWGQMKCTLGGVPQATRTYLLARPPRAATSGGARGGGHHAQADEATGAAQAREGPPHQQGAPAFSRTPPARHPARSDPRGHTPRRVRLTWVCTPSALLPRCVWLARRWSKKKASPRSCFTAGCAHFGGRGGRVAVCVRGRGLGPQGAPVAPLVNHTQSS